MEVINEVLAFVIKNAGALPADKITAFAHIISALKGHNLTPPTANQVQDEPNDPLLSEDTPIDVGEITGVSVEGSKPKGVKIYTEYAKRTADLEEPHPTPAKA